MKVMLTSLIIFTVSLFLAESLKAASTVSLDPTMGVPGEVFDLANWKLTVPTSTDNKKPTEIKQPELKTYRSVHFYASNNLLVFTAPVGGFHTVGSHYPRSELREMDGAAMSSWSTTQGTHTMVVEQCIAATPKVKDHVVAGQIHNENDVITIRLEGKHLFGQSDGINRGDMDMNYVLGTWFSMKIVAGDGRIKVYYNDVLKVDYPNTNKGCYFKAGCYTQSNPSKGDAPEDYGRVMIRSLKVFHQP